MRALASTGVDALQTAAAAMATHPLATVPADAFAFLAMARMNRLASGIWASRTRPAASSARSLPATCCACAQKARSSLATRSIRQKTCTGLGAAWAKLPRVVAGLLGEGLSGNEIAALVSHQVRALTRRAAVLAEQRLRQDGLGDAPCPYVLAVLGSAGRGESLLAMDQDNALICADGAEVGRRRWVVRGTRYARG